MSFRQLPEHFLGLTIFVLMEHFPHSSYLPSKFSVPQGQNYVCLPLLWIPRIWPHTQVPNKIFIHKLNKENSRVYLQKHHCQGPKSSMDRSTCLTCMTPGILFLAPYGLLSFAKLHLHQSWRILGAHKHCLVTLTIPGIVWSLTLRSTEHYIEGKTRTRQKTEGKVLHFLVVSS